MNGEKKAVFLFTGQGAQYYGMGKELYASDPCFREVMDDLDRIVLSRLSRSVIEVLYQPPKEKVFDRTLYTHTSLFMVQYALGACLIRQGLIPSLLMGTSLGEYLALVFSGAIDPKEVLDALIDHALDVESHCRPGGMMGIMADAGLYDRSPELRENTSLACVSSPAHFVVSGERDALKRAEAFIQSEGMMATRLPIGFGFHSPNIDPAQVLWEKRMASAPGNPGTPRIKTISCLTGERVEKVTKAHLIRIPRDPVLFPQAVVSLAREIRALEGAGNQAAIVDLGPGGFTSVLMRQQGCLGRSVKVFRVMTLFGSERRNFDKIKQELIS